MGRATIQHQRQAIIKSSALYGTILAGLAFGWGFLHVTEAQTEEMILVNGTLAVFATLGHASAAALGLLRIITIERSEQLQRSAFSALLFFALWTSGAFSTLAVWVRPWLGEDLSQLAFFTTLCGAWMSMIAFRLRRWGDKNAKAS